MATNLLTGSEVFTFKGIELHGAMTGFTDSSKPGLAVHRMLKRDGAHIEVMGREPRRWRFNVVFLGPDWRKRYRELQASIDADPKGLLVHPLLGQQRAACEGWDGAAFEIRELDTITVPVSFIEDAVDLKLQAERDAATSVSEKEQGVTSRVAALLSSAAAYTTAAVAVASLGDSAGAYASAAATAAVSKVPDPSTGSKLGDVGIDMEAAIVAVLGDPAATTNASAYDAISAAEQVYAACLDLDDAVSSYRTPLIEFTVPSTVPLATIAALYYGKDASARMDEILSLNTGSIPNPYAVPAGTVLKLYSPGP